MFKTFTAFERTVISVGEKLVEVYYVGWYRSRFTGQVMYVFEHAPQQTYIKPQISFPASPRKAVPDLVAENPHGA